ncbi:hypothetical protein U1Q18_010070 [Sarracenia purpurea var. burkii]
MVLCKTGLAIYQPSSVALLSVRGPVLVFLPLLTLSWHGCSNNSHVDMENSGSVDGLEFLGGRLPTFRRVFYMQFTCWKAMWLTKMPANVALLCRIASEGIG